MDLAPQSDNGCVTGGAGLPIKEGLEALLAEVLFSQMLCLPRPPLKPLAYSAIMVRLKLLALSSPGTTPVCS